MKEPSVATEIERLQELADMNVITPVPGIPEKLQEGAHKGIDALIEIIEDKRDDPEILKLKSNAAIEILNRAGYGPIKQVQVQQESSSFQLTREELEAFKERGMRAVKEAGESLDALDAPVYRAE
jgi:hypothetical protein